MKREQEEELAAHSSRSKEDIRDRRTRPRKKETLVTE